VPVNEKETLADWAKLWNIPVLIVVANRLGCLNHTLLTLESLRSRKMACVGIILNQLSSTPDPTARTNASRLACEAPILLEVGYGQESLDGATAIRVWDALRTFRALDESAAPLSNPAT
jgi:dethiobiotin synthetase